MTLPPKYVAKVGTAGCPIRHLSDLTPPFFPLAAPLSLNSTRLSCLFPPILLLRTFFLSISNWSSPAALSLLLHTYANHQSCHSFQLHSLFRLSQKHQSLFVVSYQGSIERLCFPTLYKHQHQYFSLVSKCILHVRVAYRSQSAF